MPPPGRSLAYVDWKSQEVALAAHLSGDAAMLADAASGDPYLAFGKRTKLINGTESKAELAAKRDQFKVLLLGTNYGMWVRGLSQQADIGTHEAHFLLRLLARTYATFADWAEAETDSARLRGWQVTPYGWHRWIREGTSGLDDGDTDNSVRNWPVQSMGSELLRVACCLLTEAGTSIALPVHDAVLVEAPAADIDEVGQDTAETMAEASRLVLGGFQIGADVKVIRSGERYRDRRGEAMWKCVSRLLSSISTIDGW